MSQLTGVGSSPTAPAEGINSDESDFSLAVAMLEVQTQRAKNIDVSLKMQMQDMQSTNGKTADYNSLLSTLRALNNCAREPKKEDSGVTDSSKTNGKIIPNVGDAATLRATAEAQCKKLGIELKSGNPGELEVMIQGIKSSIDGFGNTQQMDMIRLQNLMSKRNECFDTMTNTLKKVQDQNDRIIAHLS